MKTLHGRREQMTTWRVSRGRPECEMRGGAMTGTERLEVIEHATWASASTDFAARLESIDVILFGPYVRCEHEHEQCEPCEAMMAADAYLTEGQRWMLVGTGRDLEWSFSHRPDNYVEPVVFRIERVARPCAGGPDEQRESHWA